MILEKNIGGFDVSMYDLILMQKGNSLSKLFKNGEILKETVMIIIFILFISNFCEKISFFKSSHYRSFSYRVYAAFSNIQVVLP